MNLKKAFASALITAFALTCWSVMGEPALSEATEDDEKGPSLVGVKTCRMCHMRKACGSQYRVWKDGPHAHAYETLSSPDALELAMTLGLGHPQEEAACLKCHATAFPVIKHLKDLKITIEEGVSCESCHGPGSDYRQIETMKAIFAGEIKGESVGLSEIDSETCTACHNEESPAYKEFDFVERAADIAHPFPEGYKEEEG